jgi:tetratricopeptide (TPR) repeat protein
VKLRLATLAFVVLVVASSSAHADEGEAREHFERGQTAYDLGHYEEAISEWEQAYRLSQKPLLLFNLGQAARLKGDCGKALTYYRAYLRVAPEAENVSEAEGFVTELKGSCHERTEAPKRGKTKKAIGLVLAGSGVAALAVGVYFGSRASSLGQEVTDACSPNCVWEDVKADDAAGRSAATKQWIFYGVGVTAVAVGGILYYLGVRDGRAEGAPRVAVVPGSVTAGWSWSW